MHNRKIKYTRIQIDGFNVKTNSTERDIPCERRAWSVYI